MTDNALRRLAALALGATLLVCAPAMAEPFSMQGFTGETMSLDALPGVNLDAVPGMAASPQGDCRQYYAPSGHHTIGRHALGTTVNECTVGNFTFSTTQGSSDLFGPTIHNQYGKRPHAGWERWRP